LVLDATTLPGGRGTLVFDENRTFSRKRRFWVLEKAGTVKFTLDANDLKEDSRLTISGFKTTEELNSSGFLEEAYIK